MTVEMWDSIKDAEMDNFKYDCGYSEDLYEDPYQEIESFMKRRNF